MPEGRFKPEGKLATSHSHAFDKAIDAALQGKEQPPDNPDQPQVEPDPQRRDLPGHAEVEPQPRLGGRHVHRQGGWELGELARARLVHRLEAAELGDGDVGDDPAQAEHGEEAAAREDSEQ